MAVTIKLFKFSKKLNSTKKPDLTQITGDEYPCVFLNPQSIMNPVLYIEDTAGKGTAMLEYNYAYIPTLSRYYFISNTVLTDNVRYTYYLQVDVLASFKDDIINSRQYVLRSTNHYNDYLIDTMYPTLPMPIGSRFSSTEHAGNSITAYNNKTGTWDAIQFFNTNYSNGAILFGVTGQGNVSVDHYVASVSNFKSFINAVVTTTPTGQSWGNLPTGVQVALSNFLQYITYCKWIPFFPLSGNIGTAISSIYLGDQSFSITAYPVEAGLNSQYLRFSLNIPEHPLTSTHKYYNFTPFREVNLFFLPIGNIPIDTTKIMRSNVDNPAKLYINMIVDLASADTEYTVTTSSNINYTTNLLANGVTNIGVDLSLTEFSMSLEAALISGVSYFVSDGIKNIKSTLNTGNGSKTHTSSSGATHGGHGGNLTPLPRGGVQPVSKSFLDVGKESLEIIAKDIYDTFGNLIAPVGDMMGNLSDFISSSFGQVSTTGHTGSFLMCVATTPVVYCWFMKHGDEDYNRFGRPYCDDIRLDNISGFCLCKNATIDSFVTGTPLKPEIEAILSLLNAGIYIET